MAHVEAAGGGVPKELLLEEVTIAEMLNDSVGRVKKKLDELGLAKNTVVFLELRQWWIAV